MVTRNSFVGPVSERGGGGVGVRCGCRPPGARDWALDADLTLLAEVLSFGIFDSEAVDCCRSFSPWPALLAMGFTVCVVEFAVSELVY